MSDWVKQRTSFCAEASIQVDLSDFQAAQLLQGLIDARWITEEEAARIKARAASPGGIDQSAFDESELNIAANEMRGGRRAEALIHLERYLGREWIGRLA